MFTSDVTPASAIPVPSSGRVALVALMAVLLLVRMTPAQTVVEEEEVGGEFTIEVDQSRSQNEGKSLGMALLLSAAVPGIGEAYLKDRNKARTFLLVEVGFWAALYASVVMQGSYMQSARNFASEHAGIDASGRDEQFLERMARYRSYEEKHHRQDGYELAQVLNEQILDGNYELAPDPENRWDFGSSINPQNTLNWQSYESTLRHYRGAKVAVSFAIGALAVNRLASLVNTLHLHKKTSAPSTAQLRFTPEIGPGLGGGRVSLNF